MQSINKQNKWMIKWNSTVSQEISQRMIFCAFSPLVKVEYNSHGRVNVSSHVANSNVTVKLQKFPYLLQIFWTVKLTPCAFFFFLLWKICILIIKVPQKLVQWNDNKKCQNTCRVKNCCSSEKNMFKFYRHFFIRLSNHFSQWFPCYHQISSRRKYRMTIDVMTNQVTICWASRQVKCIS